MITPSNDKNGVKKKKKRKHVEIANYSDRISIENSAERFKRKIPRFH